MNEIKITRLDREQARNILAMMKRGESTEINGRTVIFNESGCFDVKQNFWSGHFSKSLKATLDYLFDEHELPKAVEESLKEVS